MILQANEEIRSEMLASERRRREKSRFERPFVYLDWTIGRLEAFHLAGKKRVPKRFVPHLLAVNEMLPEGAQSPDMWRTLIRDVIEQCFDLQEQLLRLRDPDRMRQQDLELQTDARTFSLVGGRSEYFGELPEEAPAVA